MDLGLKVYNIGFRNVVSCCCRDLDLRLRADGRAQDHGLL